MSWVGQRKRLRRRHSESENRTARCHITGYKSLSFTSLNITHVISDNNDMLIYIRYCYCC